MYWGEMTEELEVLYDKYYDIFEVFPDFYMELTYTDVTREKYIKDINYAIENKISLPKFVK